MLTGTPAPTAGVPMPTACNAIAGTQNLIKPAATIPPKHCASTYPTVLTASIFFRREQPDRYRRVKVSPADRGRRGNHNGNG